MKQMIRYRSVSTIPFFRELLFATFSTTINTKIIKSWRPKQITISCQEEDEIVDLSCKEEEGATPFQSDRDPQGV